MSNSRYASQSFSDKTPTSPSVCIPRVFKNITEQRILAIFRNLDLGDVVRIDMVPRQNESGEEYWRVFVHLAWGETQNAEAVRAKFAENDGCGEVKIVYDDPWFWKIRASQQKPRVVTTRNRRRPAPFIEFEPSDRIYTALPFDKYAAEQVDKFIKENYDESSPGVTPAVQWCTTDYVNKRD